MTSLSEFQTPEPWSGHISQAPILFLGSNPSISVTKYNQYPRTTRDDEAIVDYFENRFGGNPFSSVTNSIYDQLPGSERAKQWTRYWAAVKAGTAEITGKSPHEVRPGHDYALTEIVHCKSGNEEGMEEALSTCANKYLGPVLRASMARLVVVVGAPAGNYVRKRYDLKSDEVVYGPLHIEHLDRMLAFLPHPAGKEKQNEFSGCLDPDQLRQLKQWIAE